MVFSNSYQLTANVIRPPSEADSVILQLMEGCPHNCCTFCATYLKTKFHVKKNNEFEKHVEGAVNHYDSKSRRFFLCDGDVMSLDTKRLMRVIDITRKHFPMAERFGAYSRANGILKKSVQELKKLRENGLKILYLGLESGSDKILKMINKGSTSEEMIEAVVKAQGAGIKLSVMALTGLGGKSFSKLHSEKTALTLSKMNPRFINLLNLIPLKGTEIYKDISKGKFTELTDTEALEETYSIVKNIENVRSIFRANHASNPLALAGVLTRDKENLLNEVKQALEGYKNIRPFYLRGL